MRLLQAILKDALDLAQIGEVVRDEPALTYKLLRYLNSPIMGQIEKSIRQRLLRPCRFWLPVRGLAEQ
jgi:c-di-GMP-related signal transduction protein